MRKAVLAVTTVAALALTGCGGGAKDSDSTGSGGPARAETKQDGRSAEAARQVVVDYLKRFEDGDADGACALLTKSYAQSQVKDFADEDNPPKDCAGAMKAGSVYAKAFGYDPSESKIGEAAVTGDRATVVETAPAPFETTQYTLTWDVDRWLISADGGAEEAAADTERWLDNWCKVKPGMTVEQADALMGDHTGEFLESDYPQVEWSAKGYSFTAFLDTNEKINQLDTNESQLGAEDKARLKCESTRR